MNAIDRLHRAEQRQSWLRVGGILLTVLAGIGMLYLAATLIRKSGIAEGRALEKHAAFDAAVKRNADRLTVAQLHRDTTKRAAATAVAASTTHRDSSAATIDSVRPIADTLLQVGTLPPLSLPKLAIDAYRDLREGRDRDSTAIVSLQADNASLEVENLILNDQVQTYADHEKEHEGELKTASHRALWRGIKIGATTVVLVGTAIVIL